MTDTVTISRAEYEALLDKAEDAEDIAAILAFQADVAARGWDAVQADCLPAALVHRLLDGEHPLRIWREHRGLTGQQLAETSGVAQPYISDIERRKKPGSVDAYCKLAKALGVKIDDLVENVASHRDPV